MGNQTHLERGRFFTGAQQGASVAIVSRDAMANRLGPSPGRGSERGSRLSTSDLRVLAVFWPDYFSDAFDEGDPHAMTAMVAVYAQFFQTEGAPLLREVRSQGREGGREFLTPCSISCGRLICYTVL